MKNDKSLTFKSMTQKNKHIPEGYKDSPLGVIPQEWEVKRLGDVCSFKSGGTPSKDIKEFWDGSIPWISASTMHSMKIYDSELQISEAGLKSGSNLAPKGTLLLLVRGSMLWNKIPICLCMRDVAFNQDVKCVDAEVKYTTNIFLLYWILANENNLLHSVVGTGIGAGKLDSNDLKQMRLAVPPLEEQRRIAEVLGCWDEAIERQGRMVSLLTTRKRALMQRLLTPKPHWQDTELGELLGYEQPTKYIVSDTEYNERYNTPVLTAGKTFILGYTNERHGVFTNIPVILFDDFTTASRLVDFPFKVKSSATKLLQVKGAHDIKFIYSSMQNINYAIGGHERHWISKYAYITIPIPPFVEQKEIAEKLSTADIEIDLAKKRLNLLRTQKRALMQQLLTGKKQLKI